MPTLVAPGAAGAGVGVGAHYEAPVKVDAFEGSNEVYVCESLAHAEGYFEAIDVENDEYVFIGADGTVIRPSVRNGRVVLTPMGERRPLELRRRLRIYLEHREW